MTTLYLLPNLLDAESTDHRLYLSPLVDEAVASLDFLIVESEKPARRFLKRFSYPPPKTFRDIPLHLLNEHTTLAEKKELLALMLKGGKWGLVSDCGMPCLADPGADLVLMAREKGIAIETFIGPSSILLALVLSGLGGQHFTFHGYLPQDEKELTVALKEMQKKKETHLFIETPYRNERLFKTLLNTLDPSVWLCVACDLTAPSQEVATQRVKQWKQKTPPAIGKRPCVFVIRAYTK